MGDAARKAQVRDSTLENATRLIVEDRNKNIVQIEPFVRENYECLPDTCIVRRDADRQWARGEFVSGKKERQHTGVVEISGIDWLKPGDQVLFAKYGGTDFQLDDADDLVHLHRLQIYVRRRAPSSDAS
jgi:co-chaperonin GroES (HSP10)